MGSNGVIYGSPKTCEWVMLYRVDIKLFLDLVIFYFELRVHECNVGSPRWSIAVQRP